VIYDYIVAVYVNDLCIVACDPKAIVDELIQKHSYKLKGAGPLEFHLGCDFFCNPDALSSISRRCFNVFEHMFKEKPRPSSTPLEKNDHPELDDSEEVGAEMITQYQ